MILVINYVEFQHSSRAGATKAAGECIDKSVGVCAHVHEREVCF